MHARSPTPTPSCSENYPPHLLVKNLNNRGSLLISMGHYSEAITTLTKALKLTKQMLPLVPQDIANQEGCSCTCCIHDGSFSDENVDHEKDNLHFNISRFDLYKDKNGGGFVSLRPLRVSERCIEEGHSLGIAVTVMILFNLALAHHGKGMSTGSNPPYSGELQKALKLYELAYKLHTDHFIQPEIERAMPEGGLDHGIIRLEKGEGKKAVCALRFAMVISNNLCEIHRIVGNDDQRQLCMEYLLSAIMFAVDRNLAASVFDAEEMDGFYRNVSPIVLGNAASAQAA